MGLCKRPHTIYSPQDPRQLHMQSIRYILFDITNPYKRRLRVRLLQCCKREISGSKRQAAPAARQDRQRGQ